MDRIGTQSRTGQRKRRLGISMLVPIYNEEESIPLSYTSIRSACERTEQHYEIIFIDDGSRDESFSQLEALHFEDPHVKVIRFRKNYGQMAAMAAGFRAARGDVVESMDGDLQNDPADLPRLLAKIDEGFLWYAGGGRIERVSSFLEKFLLVLPIGLLGRSLKSPFTIKDVHSRPIERRSLNRSPCIPSSIDLSQRCRPWGCSHRGNDGDSPRQTVWCKQIWKFSGLESVFRPISH